MQERCVCNAGNGRREVLAPAINPERGDDLIVFLPNHRFEIGEGWSQPEIPDYFRPSLTTIFNDGTLSHHVDGGLLNLSFQDQVDALTEQVKLSAAVLYFNQKSENFDGSIYTHR